MYELSLTAIVKSLNELCGLILKNCKQRHPDQFLI